MPMIAYRCPDCGSEEENFHHHAEDAPATLQCRGYKLGDVTTKQIEREVLRTDGTVIVEKVEVELEPEMSVCTGALVQRESWFDATWSRPARGFEPLVLYQSATDPSKISVPGRNYEPTDHGYKRIEITNMAQYNRVVKQINTAETQKMSDHREMHRLYWDARRTAMRDHVNARIRPEPLLKMISRLVRARSDRKTHARYGKPLDAHFHSQLLEFNQGNIQDYCDADTGWKSRRAK